MKDNKKILVKEVHVKVSKMRIFTLIAYAVMAIVGIIMMCTAPTSFDVIIPGIITGVSLAVIIFVIYSSIQVNTYEIDKDESEDNDEK